MTAKVTDCTSSLTWGDHICDKVPFVSSVTNTLDIFQKSVFVPLSNTKTRCHYYKHLESKSFIRCLALLIPIIGNIAIFIFDHYSKKNPEKVEKAEKPRQSSELPPYDPRVEKHIPQKMLSEMPGKWLSTYPLQPYIQPGKGAFQPVGILNPVIDSEEKFQIFLCGNFIENGDGLKGVFGITKDKRSGVISTALYFLTNKEPISPILFLDISKKLKEQFSAESLSQENTKPQVYIETESVGPNSRDQKWTFFTPTKSNFVRVRLINDGMGGSNFIIFK